MTHTPQTIRPTTMRARMLVLLGIVCAATAVAEAENTTERPLHSFLDDAMAELGFDPPQKTDTENDV